jgi:adenylate kinase family enzyme
MAVERILVIGCSGSGKTTLARRIARQLALPHHSIDRVFWQPGWVEPDKAQFEAALAALCAKPRWVMDGNYSRTLPLRLRYADCVLWLDVPRQLCIARALWRFITHIGRVREDMGPLCPERIDLEFLRWIWNFRATHYEKNRALLEQWLGRAIAPGWTSSADGQRRVWLGRRWNGWQ